MSDSKSLLLGWIIALIILTVVSTIIVIFIVRHMKKDKQFSPWSHWFTGFTAFAVVFGLCFLYLVAYGENPGRIVSWWWQKEDKPAIDMVVVSAVKDLDSDGNWIDLSKYSEQYLEMNPNLVQESKGRKLYDNILKWNPSYVINSLARQVLQPSNRPQVLFLAVKLGIKGSEEKLVDVLKEHGDKAMAEDYLNCGSKKLHDGAQDWAQSHGYIIGSGNGSHRVGWGSF
jgi:hypothetical protein